MPQATDAVQTYLDARTNPTLAADPYSRDVLRSVADQLTVLADYHYRDGLGDCAAATALDQLARQALALTGEVPYLRDGEPHQPTADLIHN